MKTNACCCLLCWGSMMLQNNYLAGWLAGWWLADNAFTEQRNGISKQNETCAWTPNNVFLSMIVVESLSCKLEWGLAQVFAISIPLTIVAVESEVYGCQTKYAKAIFIGFFKHHDSCSARNGCHGAAGLRHLGLGTWRPAILISRLWAAVLRHLGWHLATSNPDIQAMGSWA